MASNGQAASSLTNCVVSYAAFNVVNNAIGEVTVSGAGAETAAPAGPTIAGCLFSNYANGSSNFGIAAYDTATSSTTAYATDNTFDTPSDGVVSICDGIEAGCTGS
jgi:hypothetical protein